MHEKHIDNIGIVKGVPQKQNFSPTQQITSSVKPMNNSFEPVAAKSDTPERLPLNRSNLSNENLLDLCNNRIANSTSSNSSSSPVIGISGSLNPPPYRNPPAPAPKIQSSKQMEANSTNGSFSPIFNANINDFLMQNVQYRDLVQLIKYQREKISNQQNDLTKVSVLTYYFQDIHFIDFSGFSSLMQKSYTWRVKDVNKFNSSKPLHRN